MLTKFVNKFKKSKFYAVCENLQDLNKQFVLIAVFAVFSSLGFFYVFQNILFSGIIVELLLLYSFANFIIAIIACSLVCYFLRQVKFDALKKYLLVFLFFFFFANEILLALIVYDKLKFLGISVPLGSCPWKWLRFTFTFIFLSTFISLSISFNSISAYFKKK